MNESVNDAIALVTVTQDCQLNLMQTAKRVPEELTSFEVENSHIYGGRKQSNQQEKGLGSNEEWWLPGWRDK